jgi:hypothetical protein
MTAAMLAVPLLAKTGEAAKAGPIGLAVIIILCIACYFLFKSMSKHLRRVRDNYPDGFPSQRPADAPDRRGGDRADQRRADGRPADDESGAES